MGKKLFKDRLSLLKNVIFHYPERKPQFIARTVLVLFLYSMGFACWICFFNSGNLSLKAFDWLKEGLYLDTLRNALTNGVIPWNWDKPFYFATKKILANPEIVLTPDILLLPLLNNGIFITVHVLLMYSFGFVGSFIIAKKMRISLVAFIFFWLLFNFNGYIIAHLAVGHFEWTGYFLLPFFFIIFFKLVKLSESGSNINLGLSLFMSLLLFLLFLNGSVHIAIWCCMFMMITAIWKWSLFPNIVIAIFGGALLALGRLLPAALWFPAKYLSFNEGYTGLSSFFKAMTDYTYHFNWESNIYIGWSGFIYLTIGILFAFNRKRFLSLKPFLFTAIIFLILSYSNNYQILTKIGIPFAFVERAPTRFIVMPFLLLLIISMKGGDKLFSSKPMIIKIDALIFIPLIIYGLFVGSKFWWLVHFEQPFKNVTKPLRSIVPYISRTYAYDVFASWSFSVISLITIVIILFNCRKSLNIFTDHQDLFD